MKKPRLPSRAGAERKPRPVAAQRAKQSDPAPARSDSPDPPEPARDVDNRYSRQRDLLGPDDLRETHTDVIGAGSLGGAIVLLLAKMGFGLVNVLRVTDFDRAEPHNLSGQWLRELDVELGRSKVDALADIVESVCDVHVETHEARFTGAEKRQLGPVVILAVDSQEERRRIWANIRDREDIRLLIDARAGGEIGEVVVFDRDRDAPLDYEKTLEGEPAPLPCHARGIAFASLGTAALVGSALKAWARKETPPRRVAMDFRNFLVKLEE